VRDAALEVDATADAEAPRERHQTGGLRLLREPTGLAAARDDELRAREVAERHEDVVDALALDEPADDEEPERARAPGCGGAVGAEAVEVDAAGDDGDPPGVRPEPAQLVHLVGARGDDPVDAGDERALLAEARRRASFTTAAARASSPV
jgi:hypothetical protein